MKKSIPYKMLLAVGCLLLAFLKMPEAGCLKLYIL
jgi:hypothetical protein